MKKWQTLAIEDNQFGDTGKGKFVDYYAEEADVVARGTGGANAGHTVRVGKKELVLHLVPSGIVRPGKVNIIGNGVVIDPSMLCEELKLLRRQRVDYSQLMIALNAKLVLPHHLVLDRLRECDRVRNKIGTTGRGIGPAYSDHIERSGLTLNDLLNPLVFAEKLEACMKQKIPAFWPYDGEEVKKIMSHPHLKNGRYYSKKRIFDIDAILTDYENYGRELAGFIFDTDEYLRAAVGKKKILLEGAQGILLSVDYGTYPYVTSSDPGPEGLAKGVGLQTSDIDQILGVTKAFYMTRVGEGPFPTEMGGKRSARWCREGGRKAEEEKHPSPANFETDDAFELGIAVRKAGNEYGATTGRPRRTGWLDLPLLRYACKFNGPDTILTKVDVLSGCETIKVCVSYTYTGPKVYVGNQLLKSGDVLHTAYPQIEVLRQCEPNYAILTGWKEPITKIRAWKHFPPAFKKLVRFVEETAEINPKIISVGPERNQTVCL